jgi:rSAM/selenodomain-associated transferase 1
MEGTAREPEGRKGEALIVFGKVPEPGAVKTRLSPPLSPQQAARLYEAFLRDAFVQYRRHPVDCLFYLGSPEPALPQGLVPQGVKVHLQRGRGLGVRMSNAFKASFEAGYGRLVIIGTDHPTLPPAYVGRAFRALEPPGSVAIGPSEDGGFYLLGMNRYFPELFDGMRYSHAGVFEATRARAERTGARLTILPEWYDIDTPSDLERLRRDLTNPAVEAPHTRRVLGGPGP